MGERKMFEGTQGKQMMIQQGYVPATCTLPDAIAGPLIYAETLEGRDVCAGCNDDRTACGGRPKKGALGVSPIDEYIRRWGASDG